VAIKAGIVTVSTKAELERLQAERATLQQAAKVKPAPIENIEALLAQAMDSYGALVANLECKVSRDMSVARNAIRDLVGGSVALKPTEGGGLDAHLQEDYAGLIALAAKKPLNWR